MTDVSANEDDLLEAGCQIASDMNRTMRRFKRGETHGAAVSFGALYRELECTLLPLFGNDFESKLREMIAEGGNEANKP